MAPRRKLWDRFKLWLRDFFPPEDRIQDDPQRHVAEPGGFFNNAEHSTVQNSTMNSVHGNQYNMFSYAEGNPKIVTKIMRLLSQHTIPGAAHDSSARDPPPRCHPDTRVKLIARITAWFEGQTSLELLLWVTGPAGVGKSAIVQTFAEYLARSKSLGASVFISRPNKRDNPHGVFITIAYQLATRIEAYRAYIVERLSRDPELPSGGMQAQFMALIVEPFVEKKIGAGGKRWGILLDGLDELRGEDVQCEIIHLISAFAHEHPEVPLVWIIASRPESHISHTFDDNEVRRSCWSECIPIDSTEACKDVERFLRSSFTTTQKKFRHCASDDWPSNTDFLKITVAASGLFIYAEVVMQFIRDSGHADPVSQLRVLLSVIDRSNAAPTKENPFVHLDALYKEILSSMPLMLWPTTKRLLGVAVYGEQILDRQHDNRLEPKLLTLRGMSILFGVAQNVVYASLDKSRSTLKIPDLKVAHKKPLTFLHASFSDYLKDSSRSGHFHIGTEKDVTGDVVLRLLEIWSKCSGDGIAVSSVEPMWQQYCSEFTGESPLRGNEKFHTILFHDITQQLRRMVPDILREPIESPACASLWKVHMRKLCYFLSPVDLMNFGDVLMHPSSQPSHEGLCRQVQLRDLTFGHFDWKEMSPAYAYCDKHDKSYRTSWALHRPRSRTELKTFASDLKSLQKRSPELKVVILGGVPKERVAILQGFLNKRSMYYAVPYPE